MKTLLGLSCFWLAISYSIAQNTLSTVYLANGDAVEGILIEYLQGTKLVIEQRNGKSTTIDTRDIERIVQQVYEEKGKLKHNNRRKTYAFKEKGIYNITYFSSLNGQQDNTFQTGLGISNIVGYQFTRLFGVGLGGGIDNYSLEDGETVFPIFVETRGYINKKILSPYYSLSLGYGFPSKNGEENIVDITGGLLGRFSLGLRLGAQESSNVLIDLGYQLQEASYVKEALFGEIVETTVTFNRIVARVGLIF